MVHSLSTCIQLLYGYNNNISSITVQQLFITLNYTVTVLCYPVDCFIGG